MTSAPAIKPKLIVKRVLSVLPERSQNVLARRYGIYDESGEVMTLEAIGEQYGITRERVRQIENHAIETIRRSEAFARETEQFELLKKFLDNLGGIIREEELLDTFGKDPVTRNHAHLLFILGEKFIKHKEDEDFHHHWHANEVLASRVHEALHATEKQISESDLVPESEIISLFIGNLRAVEERYRNADVARRWLSISKKIGRNPLGDWGSAESSNIRTKGMRDYAYLAIRRHGSPMHFTEVAKEIENLFNRKAHIATCHNELIKDERFVLVGRGLYALVEWGYVGGMVRDVIREILQKQGPLTRQEIIDKVLKERYVKENTIVVNLENAQYFTKTGEGKYMMV